MPYRDAVPRISIAQLRAQFTPRAFRALVTATLGVDGIAAEVTLVDDRGAGFVCGPRRWFECPRCRRRANVLGAVEGMDWVCARCGGWRSRNPGVDEGVGGPSDGVVSAGGGRSAPVGVPPDQLGLGPMAPDATSSPVCTTYITWPGRMGDER